MFQHTAARRRLVADTSSASEECRSFNTQPPEGGWTSLTTRHLQQARFNTQPPEGGWGHSAQKT